MDANATLRNIFSHLSVGELEAAREACIDLMSWIRRGGYVPAPLPSDPVEAWASLKVLRRSIFREMNA